MSAKVFLDTNVIVYAFDPDSPAKQEKARHLIAGEDWLVSWQVVQEFSHVALHRFARPMSAPDLAEYLELVLWPRCTVFPSQLIYQTAIDLHGQTRYRFYDCLILSAALAGGADVLCSEDMQHGRSVGPLHISNPFLR